MGFGLFVRVDVSYRLRGWLGARCFNTWRVCCCPSCVRVQVMKQETYTEAGDMWSLGMICHMLVNIRLIHVSCAVLVHV